MNSAGVMGEDYAAEYLKQHGYRVLARNFHARQGEIDIIAENDEYTVFAEVKTRTQNAMVNPMEAVTPAKQRKLIQTAELYLSIHPSKKQPRFDVIAVTTAGNTKIVTGAEHLKNAFGIE